MITRNKNSKVVLFHPHHESGDYLTHQRQPTNLLSISGFPDRQGYEVVIIDATIDRDYRTRVLKECEDALCFGTTSLIGYGAYNSYRMGKEVRSTYPSLPVVAGGWFPSTEPEMFITQGGADIVVMRQGELTFMELLDALRSGSSLEGIKGLVYRDGDGIRFNPPRELTDLNGIPAMPYHLIDFEDYFASDPYNRARGILSMFTGGDFSTVPIRTLDYFSSYGCPDNCAFCSSPSILGRKWTALEAGRIVDEVEHLVEKHRINLLKFVDANWGVSEKRVYEFCEMILKRGIKIYWVATIEVHIMNKFDKATVDLMSESGCFKLVFGAESAHPETLDSIGKNIEPGDIYRCCERCCSRGIMPSLSYIIGYPGESKASVQSTLEECCEILYRWPQVELPLKQFMPLPGTPLYEKARALGYNPVTSLEQWADQEDWRIALKTGNEFGNRRKEGEYRPELFSSISQRQIKNIQRCRRYYFWWGGERMQADTRELDRIEKILNMTARFRLKHKVFGFPVEFKLFNEFRRIRSMMNKRRLN